MGSLHNPPRQEDHHERLHQKKSAVFPLRAELRAVPHVVGRALRRVRQWDPVLEQGAPEYCCDCPRYPCEKYAHFDEFDSFSTHQGRRADMARAQAMGIAAYNREQEEKIQILDALLSQCNDGRRKTLFCVAVNLLEVTELQEAMEAIHTAAGFQDWPLKERAAYAVGILQEIAHRRNLSLKLHRKK